MWSVDPQHWHHQELVKYTQSQAPPSDLLKQSLRVWGPGNSVIINFPVDHGVHSSLSGIELEEHSVGMSFVELIPALQRVGF